MVGCPTILSQRCIVPWLPEFYSLYRTEGSCLRHRWLVSTHRDDILDAVVNGQGVARFADLSIREPLRKGQLVPVLLEWESRHSPPVNLLYRSSQRRLPRVRLFTHFLAAKFRRMEE